MCLTCEFVVAGLELKMRTELTELRDAMRGNILGIIEDIFCHEWYD